MAHSFVEFSNRTVRVNDLDLAVACSLILLEGRRNDASTLESMFLAWEDSIAFSGAGCIDLHLDVHLASVEKQHELRKLICSANKIVETYTSGIPKSVLNPILVPLEIRLEHNYRTDFASGTLRSILSVVSGEAPGVEP